ncbi:hypothetical protein AG1IA_03854 [Rhizoctonia solani AG-1 IA]|uniref:Uncharacterized protein n=1 Tax=Thanatephorus cucumeris (strain AG1-IA) TaxID=983506 RepID=L8WVH2_THACA|nr:hypothetical protein AG1IA_03854 [Rhizoctonia solani AG-1 IA]
MRPLRRSSFHSHNTVSFNVLHRSSLMIGGLGHPKILAKLHQESRYEFGTVE